MAAVEDLALGITAVHIEGMPGRDGADRDSVDYELSDASGRVVEAVQVKKRARKKTMVRLTRSALSGAAHRLRLPPAHGQAQGHGHAGPQLHRRHRRRQPRPAGPFRAAARPHRAGGPAARPVRAQLAGQRPGQRALLAPASGLRRGARAHAAPGHRRRDHLPLPHRHAAATRRTSPTPTGTTSPAARNARSPGSRSTPSSAPSASWRASSPPGNSYSAPPTTTSRSAAHTPVP